MADLIDSQEEIVERLAEEALIPKPRKQRATKAKPTASSSSGSTRILRNAKPSKSPKKGKVSRDTLYYVEDDRTVEPIGNNSMDDDIEDGEYHQAEFVANGTDDDKSVQSNEDYSSVSSEGMSSIQYNESSSEAEQSDSSNRRRKVYTVASNRSVHFTFEEFAVELRTFLGQPCQYYTMSTSGVIDPSDGHGQKGFKRIHMLRFFQRWFLVWNELTATARYGFFQRDKVDMTLLQIMYETPNLMENVFDTTYESRFDEFVHPYADQKLVDKYSYYSSIGHYCKLRRPKEFRKLEDGEDIKEGEFPILSKSEYQEILTAIKKGTNTVIKSGYRPGINIPLPVPNIPEIAPVFVNPAVVTNLAAVAPTPTFAAVAPIATLLPSTQMLVESSPIQMITSNTMASMLDFKTQVLTRFANDSNCVVRQETYIDPETKQSISAFLKLAYVDGVKYWKKWPPSTSWETQNAPWLRDLTALQFAEMMIKAHTTGSKNGQQQGESKFEIVLRYAKTFRVPWQNVPGENLPAAVHKYSAKWSKAIYACEADDLQKQMTIAQILILHKAIIDNTDQPVEGKRLPA